MQVNVTQNLAVRVVPVNNPNKFNEYDEQMGYYNAYVAGGTPDLIEHTFRVAEGEWMRGIISESVGFGSSKDAEAACEQAINDYIKKFGALCIANTNKE